MKKRFLGVLALLPIIFFACKHDDQIGLGLQQGDKLNVLFTDTTTILAYTIPETPLKNAGSFNLVGSYKDPVFGQTNADFYSQFQIPSNTVSLGAGAAFDSIVFSMAYIGSYGDTSKPQTFNVYEITESLSTDSSYSTNKTFQTSTSVGQLTFKPDLNDSVKVEGKNKVPQVRIKLNNTFGQKIFNILNQSDIDNTKFLDQFKGLQVKADANSGDGSILYFNMFSDQSGITVYYHNTATTFLKTNLAVNGTSKRVNHYTHDYSSGSITPKTVPYPAKSDTILYVQSMSGLKAKLKFPFIKNLGAAQRVAIHNAELIIPAATDPTSGTYLPASQLYVYSTDSLGNETVTLDQFGGSGYFGGAYNSTTKTYSFNLARYFQQVLNGQIKDYGLNLVTVGSVVAAERVVTTGSGKTGQKIRLKITYTKL